LCEGQLAKARRPGGKAGDSTVGQNCGSAAAAAPGECPLSRSYGDCRRSDGRSEIPFRFRVISMACEEENFPPLQRRHPKRSLPSTGCDPIERHPEVHPSGAARVRGGWDDEWFAARRRQILGARAFRSHTISGVDSVFSSWPAAPRSRDGFGRRGREPKRRRRALYHNLGVRCLRGHTISGRGFNLFKALRRHLRATPLSDVRLEPWGISLGDLDATVRAPRPVAAKP
jgi:hypothetical protein